MAQPTVWNIATDGTVIRRSAKIAFVVGIIIGMINHGDRIMSGQMDLNGWLKFMLTFLVPYSVSTYSSVMAVRERLQSLGD